MSDEERELVDLVQFVLGAAFLCIVLFVGIISGVKITEHSRQVEMSKCEAAYIASVISQLDQGARHDLKWITKFDSPASVLNRPECRNAYPNK